MIAIPPSLRIALYANARQARHHAAHDEGFDPLPVVKLFNPIGAGTWLATELADDGDTLFGLADLGFGCPELGYFSLGELASVRLPFGLFIERDIAFVPRRPLSEWADTARRLGTIIAAEQYFRRHAENELPSIDG